MNDDQALFNFTADTVNLLLNLVAPSGMGTVLLLGAADGFPSSKENLTLKWANKPDDLAADTAGGVDGAIVIPQFNSEVNNPIPPPQGNWPSLNPWHKEEYFIAHAWSQVRRGGRIVALVGKGLLSLNRGTRSEARRALRKHGLAMIAELPNTVVRSSLVNTPTYLVIFQRQDNALQTIALIDLSEEESLPPAAAFEAWRAGQVYADVKSEPAIVIQEDVDRSGRLDPDFYDPSFRAVRPPPGFEDHLLGDIAEIIMGVHLDATKRTVARPEEGGIRYLQVRHLRQDGSIDDDTYWVREANVPKHLAKKAIPGDILVSATGTIGRIALVGSEHPEGILFDTSVRRLRVKDTCNIAPQAIYEFLRSELGQLQLERHSSGAVIANVSNANLAKVRIFLPKRDSSLEPSFADEVGPAQVRLRNSAVLPPPPQTEAVQDQIAATDSSATTVQSNLHDELSSQQQDDKLSERQPLTEHAIVLQSALASIDPLLRSENPNDGKTRLKIADELRMWATRISPPSIGEIVANEFPAPLAVAYRRYEMAAHTPHEQLGRMTHLVEACVFFLFYVLVADAKRTPSLSDNLKNLMRSALEKDEAYRREDFIKEYIASADRSVSLVPKLLQRKFCQHAVHFRTNLRNPLAHSAPGMEARVKQMIVKNEPALFELLSELSALTKYKLCRIPRQHFEKNVHHYYVELYQGHALVNSVEVLTRESDTIMRADRNHLVLLCEDDDEPLDLWPYYQFHYDDKTFGEAQLCFVKSYKNDTLRGESIRSGVDVLLRNGREDYLPSQAAGRHVD